MRDHEGVEEEIDQIKVEGLKYFAITAYFPEEIVLDRSSSCSQHFIQTQEKPKDDELTASILYGKSVHLYRIIKSHTYKFTGARGRRTGRRMLQSLTGLKNNTGDSETWAPVGLPLKRSR